MDRQRTKDRKKEIERVEKERKKEIESVEKERKKEREREWVESLSVFLMPYLLCAKLLSRLR